MPARQRGAMVGGRGCVQKIGSDYLITVAWQGLTPISAPPAAVTAGPTLRRCRFGLRERPVPARGNHTRSDRDAMSIQSHPLGRAVSHCGSPGSRWSS